MKNILQYLCLFDTKTTVMLKLFHNILKVVNLWITPTIQPLNEWYVWEKSGKWKNWEEDGELYTVECTKYVKHNGIKPNYDDCEKINRLFKGSLDD